MVPDQKPLALGASTAGAVDSPLIVDLEDAGDGERGHDVRWREHLLPRVVDDSRLAGIIRFRFFLRKVVRVCR